MKPDTLRAIAEFIRETHSAIVTVADIGPGSDLSRLCEASTNAVRALYAESARDSRELVVTDEWASGGSMKACQAREQVGSPTEVLVNQVAELNAKLAIFTDDNQRLFGLQRELCALICVARDHIPDSTLTGTTRQKIDELLSRIEHTDYAPLANKA